MFKTKALAMTAILVPFLLFAADLKTSTYSSDDFKRVELETFNGSISATVTDDEDITIKYSIGTGVLPEEMDNALGALTKLASELGGIDDLNVEVQKDKEAGILKIKVDQDENESITGCNVEISVPEDIYLKLSTDNGWITVDGLKKGFDISSINGYLDIKNTSGNARFEATNGYVKIDHKGNITGNATNGYVSGKVVMADHNGACKISSVNNNIDIEVPSTVGARVSLSTVHGTTAISGFDVETKEIDGDIVRTIGDGSGTIDLSTVNGDVELREL
ncbi:hypothetical protein GX441_06140 [bacterium]|nr:hypothetical protein [bacterium]